MLTTTGARTRTSTTWTALALAFTAVGFAFAQPLFQWFDRQRGILPLGLAGAVVVAGFIHVLPALVLASILPRRRGRVMAGAALVALTTASLLRQGKLGMGLVPSPIWWLGVASVGIGLAALAVRARRVLLPQAVLLGAVSLVFPLNFIVQQAWPHHRPAVPSANSARPPVFMIVFDEMSLDALTAPDQRIDATRFPNLARLATEGIWFRQAITGYPNTLFAIPSALTGRYVDRTLPAALAALNGPSLLTDLEDRGYAVHFLSTFLPCDDTRFDCLNFRDGPLHLSLLERLSLIGTNLHTFGEDLFGRRMPGVPALYQRTQGDLLAALASPTFAAAGQATFIHLTFSHYPYILTTDGGVEGAPFTRFRPGAPMDDVLVRYRRHLSYVDRRLGEFLQALDRHVGGSGSVVVVTSDHGTCWTTGCAGRNDIRIVAPALVRVPLIVRAPGLAPAVTDADYQHFDFRRTVLAAVDGKSLEAMLPPESGHRARAFYPAITGPAVDVGLPARDRPVPRSSVSVGGGSLVH